jgi:antitoxin component YwqK of YwqJK toxin-antitoxin module
MEIVFKERYLTTIVLILFGILLASCSSREYETIKYEDGTTAVGLLKNGERYGEWFFFNEAGDTVQIANFEEGGVKDGINSFLFEGNVVIEKIYKKGSLKFEKHYYESGKIRSKGPVENNQRQGEWTNYYEEGGILSKVYMENGQPVGELVQFYSNGEMQMKGPISGDGIYHLFDTLGRLELKVKVRDGQMIDTIYHNHN